MSCLTCQLSKSIAQMLEVVFTAMRCDFGSSRWGLPGDPDQLLALTRHSGAAVQVDMAITLAGLCGPLPGPRYSPQKGAHFAQKDAARQAPGARGMVDPHPSTGRRVARRAASALG